MIVFKFIYILLLNEKIYFIWKYWILFEVGGVKEGFNVVFGIGYFCGEVIWDVCGEFWCGVFWSVKKENFKSKE